MTSLWRWSAAVLALIGSVSTAPAAEYFVYFGTYTGPKSKGVYVSRFDSATGKLTEPELAGEVAQPSWVTLHPSGRFLYAVSELGNDSIVTSFAIDNGTGKLTQLNNVSTGGRVGCHLAIDKNARTIFVAHYGDGSTAAHQLLPNGTVGEQTALIKHQGSGADQRRQRGPRAHAVVLSKDGKYMVVPDLGTDKYMVYRVAPGGKLEAAQPAFTQVKGGSGPRHFAFHPNEKFGYGLNEMGSTVTAFSFANGVLKELQTVSTLPADFQEVNNTAEIEVDEGGRFVYASNRGHDSIAVFAIDKAKGKLTEVQRESTGGKTPRNFKLDPTGQFLLAANQNTDNVVVFRRDPKSGRLTAPGQTVSVGSPVCIQFLRRK